MYHSFYPFIYCWTSRLLPCLGYCNWCCNEYRRTWVFLNYDFLRVASLSFEVVCHTGLLEWQLSNSCMDKHHGLLATDLFASHDLLFPLTSITYYFHVRILDYVTINNCTTLKDWFQSLTIWSPPAHLVYYLYSIFHVIFNPLAPLFHFLYHFLISHLTQLKFHGLSWQSLLCKIVAASYYVGLTVCRALC